MFLKFCRKKGLFSYNLMTLLWSSRGRGFLVRHVPCLYLTFEDVRLYITEGCTVKGIQKAITN